MKLVFQKPFRKRYSKLSSKMKRKVDDAIARFRKDPLDSRLKNHALKGKMKGKRAISVTGDVRIIFEEYDCYTLVIILSVGSHLQVYSM